MEFEWDDSKAESNLRKHGISFVAAAGIFRGPRVERRSDREGEERVVAVGEVEGRVVAVVYTVREGRFRIISARRARKNEERAYRSTHAG